MAGKIYNFKSVGETKESQREREAQRVRRPPIGIKTPLQLSEGDNEFLVMHYDIEKNIADNFKNLILTNHGERLFDYYFGANLKELAFEMGNEDIDSLAIERIQAAVSKYLPYVSLNTFENEKIEDEKGNPGIKIRITYTVPAINVTERSIDVII